MSHDPNALPPYMPVPVDVAAGISREFDKDIVVIVCWNADHALLHATTFGRTAYHKLQAAELGDVVAVAAGCDLEQKRTYQDFRLKTARWKQDSDRLQAILEKLPKTADGEPILPGCELFCRDPDEPDRVLRIIVDSIHAGLTFAEYRGTFTICGDASRVNDPEFSRGFEGGNLEFYASQEAMNRAARAAIERHRGATP